MNSLPNRPRANSLTQNAPSTKVYVRGNKFVAILKRQARQMLASKHSAMGS